MSIDVYPPQGLLVPGTELITDNVELSFYSSLDAKLYVWQDATLITAVAFFVLPANYAGGDCTFTLLRRSDATTGTAIMAWGAFRFRNGTSYLELAPTTATNFVSTSINAQQSSYIIPGANLLPGDVIRLTISRDGANAGDTLASNVEHSGLSITYLVNTPRVFNAQPYEEGSFTVTATGFSGTAPSGTARYIKIGKQVTLEIDQLISTSNATTFTITGFPTAILPARVQLLQGPCIDNAVAFTGLLGVDPTNIWSVYRNGLNTPLWTASGQKGLQTATYTYVLI